MFKHVLQLLVILVMSFSYWNIFAQNDLKINYLSTYRTNVFDEGAAEIAAYDAASARLYFTNTNANTLTILDISNPATPTKFADISMAAYGGDISSVAVHNGLVAVALAGSSKTQPGKVVFFNAAGIFQREVTVGVQPDMLIYTSDGKKLLTANEGEPNDDYTVDPEGSVSIVDLSNGLGSITVTTINFTEFNNKKASLLNKGVRILGPNATVAQDLEPEYITLNADNSRAYVSLQENNALAVINIVTGRVLDILPLGYKDHLNGAPVLTQFKINELTNLPTVGTPVYNGGQQPITLGGFSGLYFDAEESDSSNYVFYTVPDRGPTEAAVVISDVVEETLQDLRPFKLPDYQGRIVKMTLNLQAGTVKADQQLLLSRVDTEGDTLPISGKGNIIGYDEVPVTYTDSSTIYDKPDYQSISTGENYQELPYDPYGGDFEGIVRDSAGNFWVCDEYRPALYKFAPSGMLIERYVPQGTSELGIVPLEPGFYGAETLPRVYSKRWSNRGFEAIAYDADSSIIYAFIQSPLFNPDNTTQNGSDVVRILAVDAETGTPVAEYVYLLERNRDAGFAVSRVDKISDAVYKGNGKFLVLEGDSSPSNQSAGKKFVYEIDLKNATNILNNPIALRDMASATDKTLEQMSADELADAGIVAVHKTKILNLPSIGYNVGNQPEGLTVLPNGALVVVNDNNFGSNGAAGSDDTVLGIIRFAGDYGLDASDRDNKIDIKPQPVYGVFMPDGIATYEVNGATYIVSANGGDARAWGDFEEEVRTSTLTLDATAFPNATELIANANLGRLNVTNTQGDIDGDGDYDQLYAFGARSFSIWDAFGNLVFDSGDDLEQITAQVYPQSFNASNTDNNRDSRSDNRGPEPEALTVATIDGKPYAFIGLERIGGVMVYDISDPKAPKYVTYVNNRDFSKSVETPEAGDLGPENIVFIPKENSPSGNALMVVANDVSGSVSIFTFGDVTDVDDVANNNVQWRIFPNPVRDEILT
ncbi:MAG: choice-of-anchor I family protein, partial [Saprospiraceae bacterium]